jgi:hypothetical protein
MGLWSIRSHRLSVRHLSPSAEPVLLDSFTKNVTATFNTTGTRRWNFQYWPVLAACTPALLKLWAYRAGIGPTTIQCQVRSMVGGNPGVLLQSSEVFPGTVLPTSGQWWSVPISSYSYVPITEVWVGTVTSGGGATDYSRWGYGPNTPPVQRRIKYSSNGITWNNTPLTFEMGLEIWGFLA